LSGEKFEIQVRTPEDGASRSVSVATIAAGLLVLRSVVYFQERVLP